MGFGINHDVALNSETTLKPKGELTVTIENLTTNQVMTSPVIKVSGPIYEYPEGKGKVNHRLFSLNEPSSPELEKLAEEGDTSGYTSGDFINIADNPILPGEQITLNVKMPDYQFGASLSLVSMLANTNDAFVGLDFYRLEGTSGFGSVLHELEVGQTLVTHAKVYDAGTEYNSELCKHIPGPACNGANSKPDVKAEGYISIHPGLRLNGELSPKLVFSSLAGAKITISRIK